MASQLCPICEEGYLHPQTEQIDAEYMGEKGTIPSQYSVCAACGSEQADAADVRFNKRAMISFKKQTQGLLTGAEVFEMRKRWGLNQREAAKVFGGGPVAFSKYEKDDVMQSDAMDKLLRLANDIPTVLDKLILNAGVENSILQANWTDIAVINIRRKPVRTSAKVVYEQTSTDERVYAY